MPALKNNSESELESELARRGGRILSRYANRRRPLAFSLKDGARSAEFELPPAAVWLLSEILNAMSEGQDVTLSSSHAELTTTQAAEMLNVSRPFLTKLLKEGKLPFHMVGKHHRVRRADVIAYKERIDKKREGILTELTKQAQKERMGYPAK